MLIQPAGTSSHVPSPTASRFARLEADSPNSLVSPTSIADAEVSSAPSPPPALSIDPAVDSTARQFSAIVDLSRSRIGVQRCILQAKAAHDAAAAQHAKEAEVLDATRQAELAALREERQRLQEQVQYHQDLAERSRTTRALLQQLDAALLVALNKRKARIQQEQVNSLAFTALFCSSLRA